MAQPHKGARRQLSTRAPLPLAEIVYEAADEQGFATVNDYLLTMVANCHGYPVQVPRRPHADQAVLLLGHIPDPNSRPKQTGQRILLAFRAPLPLATLVKEATDEQGFESVSDYLLQMYAARHAYPVQVKRKSTAEQEALPMTKAS